MRSIVNWPRRPRSEIIGIVMKERKFYFRLKYRKPLTFARLTGK
jgi:hypothetical protein